MARIGAFLLALTSVAVMFLVVLFALVIPTPWVILPVLLVLPMYAVGGAMVPWSRPTRRAFAAGLVAVGVGLPVLLVLYRPGDAGDLLVGAAILGMTLIGWRYGRILGRRPGRP